jgi:hypothetical protein
MRVWISCLLSGGLLFAQAAGVARACTSPDATPAMAFADNMEGRDCEGMGSKNLCLQQCNAGDQSTHPAQASVALPPDFPVLTVPVTPDPIAVVAFGLCHTVHSPDPPPALRFCSFQL